MRIDELIKLSKEYGPVPFWFWNNDLDFNLLEQQMHEMKKQKIYEFIIHARKGLTVKYLSDEWFEKVLFVVKKAKELGMKLWIYDEENWPSGYCGGKVIKENPDFCAKHLKMSKMTLEELSHNQDLMKKSIAVLIKENGGYKNIIECIDYYNNQEVLIFTMEYTLWHPAYSDGYYTDLLNKDAIKTFMHYTHHQYEIRLKEYFGDVIQGFFTDEPGFYNNLYMFKDRDDLNTVVWTDVFSDYFTKKNDYSIIEYLPYLWIEGPHSHKIRFDFYQTVTELYIESFFKPQREFCEKYQMKLIGHVDFEDFLHMQISVQGDMTKTIGALHYAGVDKIEQNNEKIIEKLISSIGHMNGHKRVLSETYALCGWGLDFQEMKRLADYQYVRGINLLNPHAFYASIEGDRKWECPPSQFLENPYWPYYHRFSDYITRLSYLLSLGVHVADIAIYYPMPTSYDYYKPHLREDCIKLDQLIQNISFTLLDNQYDFDFLNDESLLKSQIKENHLMMNEEKYRILLLPEVSTLLFKTVEKIHDFLNAGGIVLILSKIPSKCIPIEKQDEFEKLINSITRHDNSYFMDDYMMYKSYTFKFDIKKFDIIYHQIMPKAKFFQLDPHLDIALFDMNYSDALRKDVHLKKQDPHIKYLHRRIENLDIYYLINEDQSTRVNTLKLKSIGCLKEIDLYSGRLIPCKSKLSGHYQELDLILPPLGSKLFVVDTSLPLEEVNEIIYEERIERMYDHFNILLNGKTMTSQLKSFEELGHPYFSGVALYEKEINICKNDLTSQKIELVIEDYRDCVELSINHQFVDVKLWAPYQFDIKEYLKEGLNVINLKVTNTLLNSFEQLPRPSGIIKPIKIIFYF